LSFPCFMTASKCHYVVSTLSRVIFVALLHLVVPVFVAFYWLLLHHFTFIIVFYVCEYVFLLIISALYLRFSYSASSDLSTVCVQTSRLPTMFHEVDKIFP
jgi:hypothetical protein